MLARGPRLRGATAHRNGERTLLRGSTICVLKAPRDPPHREHARAACRRAAQPAAPPLRAARPVETASGTFPSTIRVLTHRIETPTEASLPLRPESREGKRQQSRQTSFGSSTPRFFQVNARGVIPGQPGGMKVSASSAGPLKSSMKGSATPVSRPKTPSRSGSSSGSRKGSLKGSEGRSREDRNVQREREVRRPPSANPTPRGSTASGGWIKGGSPMTSRTKPQTWAGTRFLLSKYTPTASTIATAKKIQNEPTRHFMNFSGRF